MSRHLVPFGEGAAFEENLASCFCLLLHLQGNPTLGVCPLPDSGEKCRSGSK
ncbi:hypothetical protein E2I00_020074, partial [Balaenoptera physalus]